MTPVWISSQNELPLYFRRSRRPFVKIYFTDEGKRFKVRASLRSHGGTLGRTKRNTCHINCLSLSGWVKAGFVTVCTPPQCLGPASTSFSRFCLSSEILFLSFFDSLTTKLWNPSLLSYLHVISISHFLRLIHSFKLEVPFMCRILFHFSGLISCYIFVNVLSNILNEDSKIPMKTFLVLTLFSISLYFNDLRSIFQPHASSFDGTSSCTARL